MDKHTPGPWVFTPYLSNGCESCPTIRAANKDGGTSIVASCHGSPYLGFSETNPNGLLIAAAPDLLAALKGILQSVDADEVGVPSFRAIRDAEAAIAKATEVHPR